MSETETPGTNIIAAGLLGEWYREQQGADPYFPTIKMHAQLALKKRIEAALQDERDQTAAAEQRLARLERAICIELCGWCRDGQPLEPAADGALIHRFPDHDAYCEGHLFLAEVAVPPRPDCSQIVMYSDEDDPPAKA